MLKLGLAAWLTATSVCAWEHVAPSELETRIKSHDAVVAACKSFLGFLELSWLAESKLILTTLLPVVAVQYHSSPPVLRGSRNHYSGH